MPPKKAKKTELSKEHLQCLIKGHGISFEGPVSEKHFPSRYKHLFQAIRRIHTTCYEDRKPVLPHFQKERVRHIRLKARNLRENTKVYESEWRDAIENYLMRLFHEEVVCYRCKGEKWESALDALPFTKEQQVKVLENRAARKPCRCNQREVQPTPESEDSDDEGQTLIFETALGQAISHGEDDNLDGYSISMNPDRVVGLRRTGRYRRYIETAPAQLMPTCLKEKSSLLYPFLVLEAKREQDAPGFQSIGQQTAFPIRRMLQTQQSLREKATESLSEPSEYLVDPLVWFLCNQGEIWQLCAAVIEGPDIRVFELWLNNVESRDGAFQLIQIVDFIWTWARDVYRSQIRACLRSFYTARQEMSPTSTNQYTRSQSIVSIRSLQHIQLPSLNAIIEDDALLDEVDVAHSTTAIQITDNELVLRLAQLSGLSTSWAARTSIRPSDVSSCSFCVFEVASHIDLPNKNEIQPLWRDTDIVPTILGIVTNFHSHCVSLTRRQLELLRRYWTADTEAGDEDLASADTGEVVQVLLLFRTFCQPTGWQITRELSVFVYGVQAVQVLRHLFDHFGFENWQHMERPSETWQPHSHHNFKAVLVEIQKVRNLSGTSSVMHAFRGTRAILGRGLNEHDPVNHMKWTTPTDTKLHADSVRRAFGFFEALAQNKDMPPHLYSTTTRLLQVTRHGPMTNIQDSPFLVPPDVGASGAVIGIRPTSWPAQCPNFCLFVLDRIDQLDKVSLARLLEATIRARNFFAGGEGPIVMDQRDKLLLAGWVKAMKE